ncbi:MAG: hypothetical protein RL095_2993 [Verrucomicrobiota bacterium]
MHLLGCFTEGELSLNLDKLPPHQALRLQFDLLLFGTWHGLSLHGVDRLSFGPAG